MGQLAGDARCTSPARSRRARSGLRAERTGCTHDEVYLAAGIRPALRARPTSRRSNPHSSSSTRYRRCRPRPRRCDGRGHPGTRGHHRADRFREIRRRARRRGDSGRPCHQGRRHRGTAFARASRRCGAALRRRQAHRTADGPRGQEPVRCGRRGRLFHGARQRNRVRRRPVRALPGPAARTGARHGGDGDAGRQAAADRGDPGAGRAAARAVAAAGGQRHRSGAGRDDRRGAGDQGRPGHRSARHLPLDRRRHAPDRPVIGPGGRDRDGLGLRRTALPTQTPW